MLVLTSAIATSKLRYRSLLTVIVNWHLLYYKFFITDLVICHFAALSLKCKHPVGEKRTLNYELYSNTGSKWGPVLDEGN